MSLKIGRVVNIKRHDKIFQRYLVFRRFWDYWAILKCKNVKELLGNSRQSKKISTPLPLNGLFISFLETRLHYICRGEWLTKIIMDSLKLGAKIKYWAIFCNDTNIRQIFDYIVRVCLLLKKLWIKYCNRFYEKAHIF